MVPAPSETASSHSTTAAASFSTEAGNCNNNDGSVVIAACAAMADSLVYWITVKQPVQSWNVFRAHQDFVSLGHALETTVGTGNSIPAFPHGLHRNNENVNNNDGNTNAATMGDSRHKLQCWFTEILRVPGVACAPALQQFLTAGFNTIPPQWWEDTTVTWNWFVPPQQQQLLQPMPHQAPPLHATSPTTTSTTTPQQPTVLYPHHNHITLPRLGSTDGHGPITAEGRTAAGNVGDMEMSDMFNDQDDDDNDHVDDGIITHGGCGEDGVIDDDINDDYSDDEIPSAAERYREPDHQLTDEDYQMMLTGDEDVEMVDESYIGSLAQSLGASHLGMSMQLQRQLQGAGDGQQPDQREQLYPSQGINLMRSHDNNSSNNSGNSNIQSGGGLGSAMENASSMAAGAIANAAVRQTPRLDSFKLNRVIGKGSFGKVFLVTEKQTNEIYALKVLRKDNIIRRNQVEHTKTERSVLGYVKHPFIVGMNMAFQSRDKLYFVLDYCAGGELFFHLGKIGKFPENRARFYSAEIVCAIHYVHGLDIVYRDLKPENVLLTAEGHIRLTDFGLSKEGITQSSSGAHSFCGTPEYLAPEILSRQGHGRAVDWWSMGALLFEMLTGLPPFYCQDREKLFSKIQHSELHYPTNTVSPTARRLLQGLLTKDPTKRLGSGQTDAEEIKTQPFFREIKWASLARGEEEPPWRPDVRGILDTSQFSQEFTDLPVNSPPANIQARRGGGMPNPHFDGFSFTNPSFLHEAAYASR